MFTIGDLVLCLYQDEYVKGRIIDIVRMSTPDKDKYTIKFYTPFEVYDDLSVVTVIVTESSLKLPIPARDLKYKQVGQVTDGYWKGALICRTYDGYVLVEDHKEHTAFQSTWDKNVSFDVVPYGYISVELDNDS